MQIENQSDRRQADRFPIVREIAYEILHNRGCNRLGVGTTVNMSSKGLLITTDGELLLRQQLKISMRWSTAANLIAHATVVRSEGGRVALEIQHCEFKVNE